MNICVTKEILFSVFILLLNGEIMIPKQQRKMSHLYTEPTMTLVKRSQISFKASKGDKFFPFSGSRIPLQLENWANINPRAANLRL